MSSSTERIVAQLVRLAPMKGLWKFLAFHDAGLLARGIYQKDGDPQVRRCVLNCLFGIRTRAERMEFFQHDRQLLAASQELICQWDCGRLSAEQVARIVHRELRSRADAKPETKPSGPSKHDFRVTRAAELVLLRTFSPAGQAGRGLNLPRVALSN